MVQQARAVETRAAILLGAATEFQEHGYAGTSLIDIAIAAGVTKGSVYFHFDSKESLALAIIDAQHQASISIGKAMSASGTSGLEALLIMSVELARQFREDPLVSAGIRLTMEAPNFSVPIVVPYTDWIGVCEQCLRQAIAEGDVVETTDVEAMAHFIIPAFTGVQMVSNILTNRTDLLRRVEEMWNAILPVLVPADRWESLKNLPSEIARAPSRLG